MSDENMAEHTFKDRTLWHYTTIEGLVGISESRCLYASNILYLNDAKEFHHTAEMVTRWADREDYEVNERNTAFVKMLSGYLRGHTMPSYGHWTYVVSFSARGDDLGQWRAYCQGGGFSIGFCESFLKDRATANGFDFVPCLYEEDEKLAVIGRTVAPLLIKFNEEFGDVPIDQVTRATDYPRLSLHDFRTEFSSFVGDLINEFLPIAVQLKDESFAEEKECRLVCFGRNRVGIRRSRSMLVPYCRLELAASDAEIPVRQIVAGPSAHKMLNKHALMWSNFKGTDGANGETFTHSKIPYIHW